MFHGPSVVEDELFPGPDVAAGGTSVAIESVVSDGPESAVPTSPEEPGAAVQVLGRRPEVIVPSCEEDKGPGLTVLFQEPGLNISV